MYILQEAGTITTTFLQYATILCGTETHTNSISGRSVRSTIEPEIGHMKQDILLSRYYLKGEEGDTMNVILAAAGYYLRKNLRVLRAFFVWIFAAMFSDLVMLQLISV